MASIPDAVLEQLKARVNLVALIEAAGIKLKKRGSSYQGLCPAKSHWAKSHWTPTRSVDETRRPTM